MRVPPPSIVRIASRKSHLARAQSFAVGRLIRSFHPNVKLEFQFRESLGDKNQHDPLWKMPERGVFTEDFLGDLVQDQVDLVVHSWKDLPVESRPETEIVATVPRADARDVLLLRRDALPALPNLATLRLLSSSPRRGYNAKDFLARYLPAPRPKQIEFMDVRGNVPTRLRKLREHPSAHGLILAKAGLDRLLEAEGDDDFLPMQEELRAALRDLTWMVLPVTENPGAAAQGALAIEMKRGRDDLRALLAPIHCPRTFAEANEERRVLKLHGGGCHQKIGTYVAQFPFGRFQSVRGETEAGLVLREVTLTTDAAPAPTPEVRPFPLSKADSLFYARELIPVSRPEHPAVFWVTRVEALPEAWRLGPDDYLWTSGLETWKNLADRGLWVHGSNEGLGEGLGLQLGSFVPADLSRVKLGHEGAPEKDLRLIATYRLTPLRKEETPDLSSRTHFFWMSFSTFERALELNPHIIGGRHACGPGNTHDLLRERLGAGVSIEVFLNYNAFLRKYAKGTDT